MANVAYPGPMRPQWNPGRSGVITLPGGETIRTRSLREPAPQRPRPRFGVYLSARQAPDLPWETMAVWRSQYRLSIDRTAIDQAVGAVLDRAGGEPVEVAGRGSHLHIASFCACLFVAQGVSSTDAIAAMRAHFGHNSFLKPWERELVERFGATRGYDSSLGR